MVSGMSQFQWLKYCPCGSKKIEGVSLSYVALEKIVSVIVGVSPLSVV